MNTLCGSCTLLSVHSKRLGDLRLVYKEADPIRA